MGKGKECLSSSSFLSYVTLPLSNQLFFPAPQTLWSLECLRSPQSKRSVKLGFLHLASGSVLFALNRCKMILRLLLIYFLLC